MLSSKEEKLIRILELAQIELYVSEVKITNPPKHRKEIARVFIAKAVYNLQTTRDLIDRLKVDRVFRGHSKQRPKSFPCAINSLQWTQRFKCFRGSQLSRTSDVKLMPKETSICGLVENYTCA